ncbi:hypothetical protein C0Q44_19380 [Paenibacillus sp. PCH8]|uniref:hypothetical protein n=1 Tax=Paenibacillus sp. PCH8 TaxID=2066524 RepID=UPI000CF99E68|nr:hypothetical protein [Paenibacillus sp. PCH8]PQP81840.1 hypothetical protein C0Q44_19380 [Paenibacillus sp. PCH8]
MLVVIALGNTNNKPEPEEPAQDSKAVSANEQVDKGDKEIRKETEKAQVLDKEAVLTYTANIRGRAFVKEVLVGDHNINVVFHDTFENYKSANPESGVSEEDYVQYFASGDETNKILMEESVRLLKQFIDADNIVITVPFEGKTHSVDLKKSVAETYFNVDFNALNADPEAWKSELSSKYFNKNDRQKFVDEFVQVK